MTFGIFVTWVLMGVLAGTLKTIRLDLAYVPSPYHEVTADFAVSIGAQ
jgi:hypothetical protein